MYELELPIVCCGVNEVLFSFLLQEPTKVKWAMPMLFQKPGKESHNKKQQIIISVAQWINHFEISATKDEDTKTDIFI